MNSHGEKFKQNLNPHQSCIPCLYTKFFNKLILPGMKEIACSTQRSTKPTGTDYTACPETTGSETSWL